MLWSDLRELKEMLEIDPGDRSEDLRLNFWLKLASDICEGYLGYSLFRQERTEFYKGTNTQKLVLRSKPAYSDPTPQVWVDEGAHFGANPQGAFPDTTKLTYGTDYSLWMDDDQTKSKRAILLKYNGYWQKTSRRQAGLLSPFVDENYGSIKVTYTAGYYPEDLPGELILACVELVARLRFMMPLGLPMNSDSFAGRSVSIAQRERNWLLDQVKHRLFQFRTRRF